MFHLIKTSYFKLSELKIWGIINFQSQYNFFTMLLCYNKKSHDYHIVFFHSLKEGAFLFVEPCSNSSASSATPSVLVNLHFKKKFLNWGLKIKKNKKNTHSALKPEAGAASTSSWCSCSERLVPDPGWGSVCVWMRSQFDSQLFSSFFSFHLQHARAHTFLGQLTGWGGVRGCRAHPPRDPGGGLQRGR